MLRSLHAAAVAGPFAAALALGLVLAGGCARAVSSGSQDERLARIYSSEWKWREQQLADDEDGWLPVVDHLPRVDPETQRARLLYWQQVLRELDGIDRSRLSRPGRVNFDVYRPQILALVANQQFRDYEMPANSDSTFWTDLGYTARRAFRSETDYRNWIAQMRDIPRYFHEQMQEMRAGLRRGFTPPAITMQGRDASLLAVTEATPEDSLFYTPFRAMPVVAQSDRPALRSQAVGVIRDIVQPAYRELLSFMRNEYLPGARTTLAAYDLPDGRAYYRAKIREYTTLDMEPAAIHSLGEAQVARLHEQMLAVMRESRFKGDFPAFLSFLRSDPRFYARSAQELLWRAAWIAKRFDGKAAQFFGYLPRQRFTIKPVPPDLAPFYTAGRGGAGIYLVNTYELNTRPLYNLTALTLHEAAPGHAFQIPIAAEHEEQPEFRRHTYLSVYGEGWALYCERLGDEMGMYETPYDRFGMLGYQIWRAARLVVDTGIHSQGWTRERALAYMRQYTALSDHEIQTEVDRYIAWPAQALSYYLGERAILEARQRAQQALGARFNLRAFHDAVLELGSVPIPVLQRRIDHFIADGGTGPYPELE